MAAVGGDQRKRMEAPAEDKFPEGLRVLAVDDDCVCLKVLEAVLRRCKYHPTAVMDGKTALKMLRAGKEQFDLVITDVRMPGMDGFKLLELIRLEMDLPVIMLSVDCDKMAVMKAITHGACDYLVKPVRTNELKNIWQYVERRINPEAISHISSDDDDVDERVQPETIAKSTDSESNKGDDFDQNTESAHISTTNKKPTVEWTIELHNKFLEAIHQIGLDRAVPKTILELMNVDYLTRENIASHLQKYRLHRRRVNSNPVGDAPKSRNLSYDDMNNKGSFMRNHEHERWRASSGGITTSSSNHFSATDTQSNLCMGSFIHGGRIPRYVVPQLSDAIRFTGSSNPPASLHNILNVDEFSSYNSGISYADLMRGTLVETSKGKTPSNLLSSFTITPSSSMSSTPTNEYVVHPQQSSRKYHNIMNGPSTQVGNPSKLPSLLGNYTKSCQSTGTLHRCGTSSAPSHVKIPRITQLARYATPSFQMPLQIETTPFIGNTLSVEGFSEQEVPLNAPNNQRCVGMFNVGNSAPMAPSEMVMGGDITTSVAGFSEQMVPFNVSRNTSLVGTLPNDNSAPDSFVAVTNMLDGEGTTDIHDVQEGIVDQPVPNDQLDAINDLSWGDILSNPLNEDFTIEDAFMGGE